MEESRGCVMGFRCQCNSTPECDACTKCISHHHRNCTKDVREKATQLRVEYIEAIDSLRGENEINIFEYGEVEDDKY